MFCYIIYKYYYREFVTNNNVYCSNSIVFGSWNSNIFCSILVVKFVLLKKNKHLFKALF